MPKTNEQHIAWTEDLVSLEFVPQNYLLDKKITIHNLIDCTIIVKQVLQNSCVGLISGIVVLQKWDYTGADNITHIAHP